MPIDRPAESGPGSMSATGVAKVAIAAAGAGAVLRVIREIMELIFFWRSRRQ